MLLPQMEVMKHELSIVEYLMIRDANLSIGEGLVELAATLEIQMLNLEVAKENWKSALAMTDQVHRSFLEKSSLSITTQ